MAKGLYHQWITEEGQKLLRGWKRSGMTDEDIAKKMEINPSTLWDWKKKHKEISNALKKGKQLCDFEAEEALIGQFEGHYVTDTITEIDEKDGVQKKHIKQTKRWVEPNTTAIIFYLKCRAGWKEKGQEDQTEVLERIGDMIASVEKQAHERVHTE